MWCHEKGRDCSTQVFGARASLVKSIHIVSDCRTILQVERHLALFCAHLN